MRLINYRADKTPFVNDLTIVPLLDELPGNAVTHFLGIICERPLPGPLPSTALSLAPPIAALAPTDAQDSPGATEDVFVAAAKALGTSAATGDDAQSTSGAPSALAAGSRATELPVGVANAALPGVKAPGAAISSSVDAIFPSSGGGGSGGSANNETAPYVPTKLQEALQVQARRTFEHAPAAISMAASLAALLHPRTHL